MALREIDNRVTKLAVDTATRKLQVVSSTGGKITLIKQIDFNS